MLRILLPFTAGGPIDVAARLIDSIALRRFGTADDIAKVAEFLVSDLASFVTGQSIAVNGGWTLGPC